MWPSTIRYDFVLSLRFLLLRVTIVILASGRNSACGIRRLCDDSAPVLRFVIPRVTIVTLSSGRNSACGIRRLCDDSALVLRFVTARVTIVTLSWDRIGTLADFAEWRHCCAAETNVSSKLSTMFWNICDELRDFWVPSDLLRCYDVVMSSRIES